MTVTPYRLIVRPFILLPILRRHRIIPANFEKKDKKEQASPSACTRARKGQLMRRSRPAPPHSAGTMRCVETIENGWRRPARAARPSCGER
jgi:hypothetical protein